MARGARIVASGPRTAVCKWRVLGELHRDLSYLMMRKGVSVAGADREEAPRPKPEPTGRDRAHKPEAQAKGIFKRISFNALRLRFRLVASDFPGIVGILDGD